MIQPLIAGHCPRGNHSTTAWKQVISAPAAPIPMMARPATSTPTSLLSANMTTPTVASSIIQPCTRRGP